MGRGWKKSNWNSAAGCEFTVHFVVSKKVLRISLETSFDAIAVIAAGTDHLQEYVLGAIWVTGIIESLGKARVRPMHGSNWRMRSSPASPQSWPGDGSITSA